MRSATVFACLLVDLTAISTHAPLARRDLAELQQRVIDADFYSRASCEARHNVTSDIGTRLPFLLTRLLRGATGLPKCKRSCSRYFYSRASCEARPLYSVQHKRRTAISTHAPLARRDGDFSQMPTTLAISTHTPLARRDADEQRQVRCTLDFYSHASCEARPPGDGVTVFSLKFLLTRLLRGVTFAPSSNGKQGPFLLTRLLRGVTGLFRRRKNRFAISTHTPLARRDAGVVVFRAFSVNFYSHASCEA